MLEITRHFLFNSKNKSTLAALAKFTKQPPVLISIQGVPSVESGCDVASKDGQGMVIHCE
ncbi:hypothetical protein EH221_01640 [bacterium]|nr:MAG: hypothetical protein EH221_01640 [bacterium]